MARHRADRECLKVKGIRHHQWDPSYRRGEPCSVPRLAPAPGRGPEDRVKRQGQERYHAALLAPRPLTDERQGVFLTDQLLLSTDPGTLVTILVSQTPLMIASDIFYNLSTVNLCFPKRGHSPCPEGAPGSPGPTGSVSLHSDGRKLIRTCSPQVQEKS